jgi:hypothetical protein
MKTEAPGTAKDNTSSKDDILHTATQDLIPASVTATFIVRHLTSTISVEFSTTKKLILL